MKINRIAAGAALTFAVLPISFASLGDTTLISLGINGETGWLPFGSYFPCMSENGRYVAFSSGAENLVVGDTNYFEDIFVRDRLTNDIWRASVSSAGIEGGIL